ncbi:MAG: DegT/DnrJ/EryC1/StrS family aminotransferase [Bryobacteraceae bacterium]
MAERRVPHKPIPVAHPVFWGNEKKYVDECLETSWISSVGRFIPAFEQEFARFCGVEHAVSCDTGTSAVHLALMGFGVQAGDEVIVPSLTFIATANAVRYCGAKPVFVDCDEQSMNITPALIEPAITERTRGIIVVHLFGHPADMDPILLMAKERGLFVIEDAAEAHGAIYRGRPAGGLADAGTFSFFGNKIITTGEGGMVTTRDAAFAQRLRILRGQGMDPNRRYWFPIVGYNYRMTNIQAAIGLAQMEDVDAHLAARHQIASWYRRHLEPLKEWIQLPMVEDWAVHACWMFTVVLRDLIASARDQIMRAMATDGIETRPFFHPLHSLPPYDDGSLRLPITEKLAGAGIMLPTHALLTEDDIRYIASSLASACHAEAAGR